MGRRVSFSFQLVAQEAELAAVEALVGKWVAVTGRDGSQKGFKRGGTIKVVNDIGIELVSPTGTVFGFPWEGIERVELI